MHLESAKILKEYPLMEGEEIIAEAFGTHPDGQAGGLLVTQWRSAGWLSGQRFSCPLHTVVGYAFNGGVVRVIWDTEVEHILDTTSIEAARAFYIGLAVARSKVMRAEAEQSISRALDATLKGDVNGALANLAEASAAEPFHSGPALLSYHLHRWLGDRDAAVAALSSVAGTADQALSLLSDAPLNALDLYVVGNQLGVSSDAGDLDAQSATFAALRARRMGDVAETMRLFDLAIVRCDDDPAAIFHVISAAAGIVPMDGWPRLLAVVHDLRRRVPGLEKWADMLATVFRYAEDPYGSMEALQSYVDANEFPQSLDLLRFHQDWEKAATNPGVPLLEPADLEMFGRDPSAFERVRECIAKVYDPERRVEVAWALLRLGRVTDARESMTQAPGVWYRSIAAAFPADHFIPFLAGLTEAESLIRLRRLREADLLLDAVYRERVSTFGDSRDLYLRHASNLFSLYRALATGKAADVRMYAGLLEVEPCLTWVRSLVALCPAEAPLPGSGREDLRAFEVWVAGVRQPLQLDASPRFKRAASQLEHARNDRSLRVVIGGETSAGKSSFINALLGEHVLFVTEEEATAVPTRIRRGPTWAAEVERPGRSPERIDVGPQLGEPERARLHAWIRRFTFVGSPECDGVVALDISVPSNALAEGLVYIDTPGLNAHALRTERAQQAIEDAHACIFVVDAGSALKAGEMAKIRWASSEVGKTIFVLNKMDKAIGDPDLDCDADAVPELLARVQSELTNAVGVAPVLFAVCSLPEATVRLKAPEALPFVQNIPAVRRKLAELLRGSDERLILRAAAKVARVAASEALDRAAAGVSEFEREVGRLSHRLPDTPANFRAHILNLSQGVWGSSRGAYIERMDAAINAARERCLANVTEGMNRCGGRPELKAFVNTRVRGLFQDMVTELDAARAREWATLGKAMSAEVQAMFNALYADAKFRTDVAPVDMLRMATQIPLAHQVSDLTNAVDGMMTEAAVIEVGGAAAGALLGTMIFPGIGTMIGAWLGGTAGGSVTEDLVPRVYERIEQRCNEIMDKVIEALNADIAPGPDGSQPILNAIGDLVDHERARFEQEIRARIARVEVQRSQAMARAEGARRQVSEAAMWLARLEATVQAA